MQIDIVLTEANVLGNAPRREIYLEIIVERVREEFLETPISKVSVAGVRKMGFDQNAIEFCLF